MLDYYRFWRITITGLLISVGSAGQNTYPWPQNDNIGIGLNTPEFKLHINGTSVFQQRIESSGWFSGFLMKSANATRQFGLHFGTDGASGHNTNSVRFGRYGINANQDGAEWLANPVLFDLDAPDASLTLDENGRVGIGTLAPQYKLDVKGIISAPTIVLSENWDNVLESVDNGNRIQLIGTYRGWDPKAIFIGGYNAGNSPNFFTEKVFIGNYAFSSNYLCVNLMNGGVGIGTTNTADTDFRLFVETGIRTRKVRVDQNTWADFVFSPEYRLPALSKLEAFIKKNKHLPGIPSAEEVSKEGIDLGEMNARLLQKIEELTLYMIDQDKKLEEQQLQLAAQQEKLEKLEKGLQNVKHKSRNH